MPPLIDDLSAFLQKYRDSAYLLLRRYRELHKDFLLQSDLHDTFEQFCSEGDVSAFRGSPLEGLINAAQVSVVRSSSLLLAVRWSVARWGFMQIDMDQLEVREISVRQFLQGMERVIDPESADGFTLDLDLKPFERGFPRLREARSIGHGAEYLNRYLSNRLFREIETGGRKLLEFLRLHRAGEQTLLVNQGIDSLERLIDSLRSAEEFLGKQPAERPWSEVAGEMARRGFEPGWGGAVGRARDTMNLLSDLLEAPSPDNVARFLGRIPMIFNIVIMSPHGYFGQADVLGKPDTGGQVVYILDQVRALERAMIESNRKQGIDVTPNILVVTRLIPEAEGTTCNIPLEPIIGTQHARILRVPFRSESGEIVPHWISRFLVWPYLERFAVEVEREIRAELGDRPDFIVGNYSDGNLVASILSQRMGVTQCNIAHALEKTKYLFSDLYWKDHEGEHNFACQYTADLIAMNAADFIIASTYQEIAGTPDSIGQYESYQAFSLPGLYRVLYGIDVYDPKFNIVSPGADANVFFPYGETQRRPNELQNLVAEMVHGDSLERARGVLADKSKPLLFAMSRIDHIKNPSGLLEWYANCPALRERANFLFVGGMLQPDEASDPEQVEQVRRMHELIDEHGLDGQVRWLEMQADKHLVGELYRYVADTRGVFVQPALFEAFGLTVIEAMVSGLPTFATCYGGPAEIIVDGVSGFHIDPNHGDAAAEKMLDFLARCDAEAGCWERLSQGGIERVNERYTWTLYADRMLKLSRIYGFWKFISNIEREESARYLEMFYFLMYRRMADKIAEQEAERERAGV
ncbi:MAG: sucrose synthase [Pirellulaceae bacterium]